MLKSQIIKLLSVKHQITLKVDNTINIENTHASQIVEEIRRERERKVLQKRRFKKALQQNVNKINSQKRIQFKSY